MKVINLTGKRFGRLLVECRDGSSKKGQAIWLCRCDCGNIKRVRGDSLRRSTLSCGCLGREAPKRSCTTHGMSKTSTYRTWVRMRRRCYDKSGNSWEWYGARGIKVCKRWHKFENFYADMGERPKGMTLDRRNNSKDYLPSNCRWASWRTQLNNRRDNHLVTFHKKTQTIAQWSREIGISQSTLLSRFRRGWSVERALTEQISEV